MRKQGAHAASCSIGHCHAHLPKQVISTRSSQQAVGRFSFMACSSAGTERSRAPVVHSLIPRCHSYVCVIAEFSQTIDDSNCTLERCDAMRCASPVTAPPPPCVPLEPGMGCDGKGWLFMRVLVLDPRICVRHMRFRAKTEAVRLIAYFCARSTALTTTERVYWACPASHMMFSEWSRQ